MQKLVTVLLQDGSKSESRHGQVEEHLDDYLSQGWRVVSVTSVGQTGGQSHGVRGWMVVVLEKD